MFIFTNKICDFLFLRGWNRNNDPYYSTPMKLGYIMKLITDTVQNIWIPHAKFLFLCSSILFTRIIKPEITRFKDVYNSKKKNASNNSQKTTKRIQNNFQNWNTIFQNLPQFLFYILVDFTVVLRALNKIYETGKNNLILTWFCFPIIFNSLRKNYFKLYKQLTIYQTFLKLF